MADKTLGAIESAFPTAGTMLRTLGLPIKADVVSYLSHQIGFLTPVHLTETDRIILAYLYLCQPVDNGHPIFPAHQEFLSKRGLNPTIASPVDAVMVLYEDKRSSSIPSIVGFIVKLKVMGLVKQVGKGKGRYFVLVDNLNVLLTTDFTKRLIYFVEE
jgi:hypothetical protein